MKQTKVLTRCHRQFLEKKGYSGDLSGIRFVKETPTEYEFYDVSKEERFSLSKGD